MASITPLDLGTVAGDGTGDGLRDGGTKINANFAAVNAELAEKLDETDVGTSIGSIVRLVSVSGSPGLPAISGANLTGLAGGGDMTTAVYDPQAIADDAFDRANHTGTQLLATISDAGALAALDEITTAEIAASAYASEGEAEAGTEDTKIMTPAKVAAAIVAQVAIAGTIVTATPTTGEFLVDETMTVDDNVTILADEAVDILIPQDFPAGLQLDITVDSASVTVSIEDWVNTDDGYFEFNATQVGTITLRNPGRVIVTVVANAGTVPIIRSYGSVVGLATAATGPLFLDDNAVSGGIFLAEVSTDNTGRTLALADAEHRVIECDDSDGETFTIPANATVAFPVGAVIGFLQLGAGAITVAAGGGVTLEVPDGLTAVTRGENHMAFIRKRATNTWHIAGGLADAS